MPAGAAGTSSSTRGPPPVRPTRERRAARLFAALGAIAALAVPPRTPADDGATAAVRPGSASSGAVSPSSGAIDSTVRAPERATGRPPGSSPTPPPEPSYLAPVLEILGFNAALWAFDRYALDADFARISGRTVFGNLTNPWVWDTDDFQTNELLHPYQGSVYHTAARSSGFGFWGSVPFTFGGSFLWKIAGENGKPSINDQITTTVAGVFLGEALFRLSRLVLDRHSNPGLVRRLASAALAPAAGFNDLVLPDRSRASDPEPPPFSGRLSLGVGIGRASSTRLGAVGIPARFRLGLSLTYGLPGETVVRAPFDHFDVSLDLSSGTAEPWNQLHDERGPDWLLAVRGLVGGGQSDLGDRGRVLYGMFGTFDYGGPVLLRVAESGVGPGVVFALRPAEDVALDATLLASATFGSGGGYTPPVGDRDYRFGFGALVVADGRLRIGDRVEVRAAGRGYLVPSAIGTGDEELVRGTASARYRIAGPHCISADAAVSFRNASYPGSGYREETAYGGISYTYEFGTR